MLWIWLVLWGVAIVIRETEDVRFAGLLHAAHMRLPARSRRDAAARYR